MESFDCQDVHVFKRLYNRFTKSQTWLFYRDLTSYTGGHQKVADYFQHVQSVENFHADIAFSERSRWDEFNPWFPAYQSKRVEFEPVNYDYAFLAGMDWRTYLAAKRPAHQPVINLIQHVRHADPKEELAEFLSQRAIRICVSQQVADAIQGTGRVNGPVFTIPNGVELPHLDTQKTFDLVLLGIKQPELASGIYERLSGKGLNVLLVNQQVPRSEWFKYLAASRIALLLPNATEGFYLPALEAMNFCDLVIVPDCIGNRDFCKDDKNCLIPQYTLESIVAKVELGLGLLHNEHVLTVFKREMRETLTAHTLANERKAFAKLMGDVKGLWAH